MPFFISPLDSQLTVKHKLSFFSPFSSVSLICPFAACCHTISLLSPLFLLCVYCLSFALSPPCFFHFLQGNMKKKTLSCSFSFCALSIKKANSVLSRRRLFRMLLFKVNEDHISSAWSYMAGRSGAGLLWENKYYGRSNFVILI